MIFKVWQISEDESRRTLEVALQINHQDPESNLSRKFSKNDCMLQYKTVNTYLFSDTFWVTKIAKSIRGFTCMQLFVSDKVFVKVYGMNAEK